MPLPPAQGALKLQTSSGAMVWVGDHFYFNAPDWPISLSPGKHHLTIGKDQNYRQLYTTSSTWSKATEEPPEDHQHFPTLPYSQMSS
jgi:hypothetical protein